ncbi:lysozyme inhibitor LprI family protein [Lacrimispora sp. 38-1]|uniref:lysozyme inhibitor LprI family protein n=1 Tax=Lacrimispora sp. 38-1 TaxID=3125778 RepID=UPI003CEB2F2D
MNRNRGIWIVIGSILVIGILVTFATFSFVKGKDSTTNSSAVSGYSEDSQFLKEEKTGSGSVRQISPDVMISKETQKKSVPEETEASSDTSQSEEDDESAVLQDTQEPMMKRALLSEPAAEGADTYGESETQSAVSEPVITPITPDSKAKTAQAAAPSEGADYFRKHLKELDAQIKKMREDSADSNTYSMKALADKELKLWNREQNTIYEAISETLPEDLKRQLEASQQSWIKDRDIKAGEAAKKYSGGTLEELEYTASLAESTRERAYSLIEEYAEYLTP